METAAKRESMVCVERTEEWRNEDGQPISIGADCGGIGAEIEGIAKLCENPKITFISEICDQN